MRKIKYIIITCCSTGIGYKTAKYLKEKNDLLKKCERFNAMMTEPIPQRLRVEFLGKHM